MTKEKRVLKEFFRLGYNIDDNGIVTNPKNKIIKGCVSPVYLKIGLRILEFDSYPLRIHRIQGYKKYEDKIFEKKFEIRHKDGNPLNNSWKNILIGTHSDNMMDIPKVKRRVMSSSPKHNHKSILEDRKNGMTYKELMKKHNISSLGTVSFIVNKSLSKEGVLV